MYHRSRSMITILIISFGVCFLACAGLVILLGGKILANSSVSLSRQYDLDVPLWYIVEKVRQHDYADGVQLINEQVLMFTEPQGYVTYLYVLDNQLMEVTQLVGEPFEPIGGQEIATLDSLNFERLDHNIVKVIVKFKDDTRMMIIHPRGDHDE
jgi:hypothetical protein